MEKYKEIKDFFEKLQGRQLGLKWLEQNIQSISNLLANKPNLEVFISDSSSSSAYKGSIDGMHLEIDNINLENDAMPIIHILAGNFSARFFYPSHCCFKAKGIGNMYSMEIYSKNAPSKLELSLRNI